jgi:hypothetical protein
MEEQKVRVLIACEFSGVVREAFRKRGHDAWSLDLLDSEDHSKFHYYDYDLSIGPKYDDMLQLNAFGAWDLLIAHPPCTYLCNSGVRWLYRDGRSKNGMKSEGLTRRGDKHNGSQLSRLRIGLLLRRRY